MNSVDLAVAVPPRAERLTVNLAERSYDIVVGSGLMAAAGTLIRPVLAQPRVAVVTDAVVGPLYLPVLERALAAAGIRFVSIVLPAGEGTKNFAFLQELCERLLAARMERGTTLIALGGGVVGDLAGFAAGILLRGLAFIQVPTTLLAQVDSAVGGKTGINSAHGKNLIGLFHQPRLVLADTDALDSLPPRQLRAGYAEVVKYGLMGDAAFFQWLEGHGDGLLAGDAAARAYAVMTSCKAKAAIVARDEREAGDRALLNLGHTFGHALEAETGFSDALLHGEAVAFGMVMAFTLSQRLGLCAQEDVDRVVAHLRQTGLPTGFAALPPRSWSADALLAHMHHDKKVADGRLTFVLARGIGRAFVTRDVPLAAVRSLFAEMIAA